MKKRKSPALEIHNLVILITLIITFLLTISIYFFYSSSNPPIIIDDDIPDNTVIEVIDGDTFVIMLNQTKQTVRLLCVDAPEKGAEGCEESTNFLKSLLLNKQVRLISDVEDKDKYGRLLRYVYVNLIDEDNKEIFINKELVKKEYASLYLIEPNTRLCNEINISS